MLVDLSLKLWVVRMAKKFKDIKNPPTLKPCKNKKAHPEHHHTEGGGFNFCDGVKNSQGFRQVEGWRP